MKLINTNEKNDYIRYLTMSDKQRITVNDNMTVINKLTKKLDFVKSVYQQLKNRDINPSGNFDKVGRWYADNDFLISCRSPSRAFPYSEMSACRALKYVKKCAIYFDCKNETELLAKV